MQQIERRLFFVKHPEFSDLQSLKLFYTNVVQPVHVRSSIEESSMGCPLSDRYYTGCWEYTMNKRKQFLVMVTV